MFQEAHAYFAVVFFSVPLYQPSQRVMYVSPPYLSLSIISLCTPTQADGRGGGVVRRQIRRQQRKSGSLLIFSLFYHMHSK
jgi:hypothetical protein